MSADAGPCASWSSTTSRRSAASCAPGLGSQGYVVLEADDGQPALDIARRNGTDLIVLDLGLPDIDGIEVIRAHARGAARRVPIIVLSSRDDEAGKVEALDLGADDYVTKPFGMDELLARIRAALRHRLQRQGERPVFRTGDLTVDLVRRDRHGAAARRSSSRRRNTTCCACWCSTPARC